MSKDILVTTIAIWLSVQAFSQISFSDQTSLLADQTIYSGCAMGISDMNGDNLDDIIRLDNAQTLYIEYQKADGSSFDQFYYGTMGTGSQWSLCIADVDGNGYNDILAGGAYNKLKLLKANASGNAYTQTDIVNPSIFLQGSNFADIDNNGAIDIFACHDDGLSAPFNNDGSGNFTHDISLIDASSTVPSDNSGNYGSIWTDYDNDGDLDMYLSKCRLGVSNPNDGRRLNLLFQNDGSNNYTDVAPAAGLQPMAQSWAADFGDVDNDGDLDCFIINHDMTSQIYKNNGDGTFTDFTAVSGLEVGLGDIGSAIQCIFDDFDNDGFVDLLVTSPSITHKLFRNNGDLTFTTVSNPFPTGALKIQSAVTGDLNNDGYLDVYAGFASGYNGPNSNRPDKLYFNTESGFNYLKLLLQGDNGNANAIGARVEIYGDWGVQVKEVRSGESYGIMNSFVLHFGLGTATEIDNLVIHWPNGQVQEMCGIAANESMALTQNNLPALLTSSFTYTEDGNMVTFTNTSGGIPDDFDWDFGDGTSSNLQNPVHTFPTGGPYTITLTISNDCETAVYSEIWENEGPLPLELLAFSANLMENAQVAVKWRSENETGFDHFELERSIDLRNSKVLATIAGNNTAYQNHYEWIDPDPEIGENYYRLKLVDMNGSFEYSNWINVDFHQIGDDFKIFPNPALDRLQVSVASPVIESYSVYNITGNLIKAQQNISSDNFEINLTGWESGIYFLQVKTNEDNRVIRFSKI